MRANGVEEITGGARLNQVLTQMRLVASPGNLDAKLAGMRRFGIHAESLIGLSTPEIRKIARHIGRDQPLAEALWETGVYDARILASLITDPALLRIAVMDRWARDFDSWSVCDACCCNAFDRSPHAWKQIAKWAKSDAEFVRRAAFATIAALAVHDKKADDQVFLAALPLLERYAFDERNFVKKAVNWALRNIGKRNAALLSAAIGCAERIRLQGTSPARWIAADALRELRARR